MDQLITKYKISISVISMILLLIWVWSMATVVTGKEEHINQALDMLSHTTDDHGKKIVSLHHRTNECEKLNSDVRNDVKLIQKDVNIILKGVERLQDRMDVDRYPMPNAYGDPK